MNKGDEKMTYTKEQWSKLDEKERTWLVNFWKNDDEHPMNCSYLSGTLSECPICGELTGGGGVCYDCLKRAIEIEKKMG